ILMATRTRPARHDLRPKYHPTASGNGSALWVGRADFLDDHGDGVRPVTVGLRGSLVGVGGGAASAGPKGGPYASKTPRRCCRLPAVGGGDAGRRAGVGVDPRDRGDGGSQTAAPETHISASFGYGTITYGISRIINTSLHIRDVLSDDPSVDNQNPQTSSASLLPRSSLVERLVGAAALTFRGSPCGSHAVVCPSSSPLLSPLSPCRPWPPWR